jgi:hypothetical protein
VKNVVIRLSTMQPPKSRGEYVLQNEKWDEWMIAAFLGLPIFLIQQSADFPPPDDWYFRCAKWAYGACDEELDYCDGCKRPLWKPETVKMWAEARGLVFAPLPLRRWL